MLYVIYNKATDINDFVTENKASALMRAGELIDRSYLGEMIVDRYDMTEDEYNDLLDPQPIASYSLKEFIEQFGEEPQFKELTPAEAERLINLSPE